MREPGKSPTSRSEEVARAFGTRHDRTEYLDWSAATSVRLPKLKRSTETISLQLTTHTSDSIHIVANVRDVPDQSSIKPLPVFRNGRIRI